MSNVSRRTFLLGMGAVSYTVLAACSNTDPGTGEKITRLVLGVNPPSQESNDPNRELPPNDEFQLKPMYENLVGTDPRTGEWVPWLAESWALEPDGRSLRFVLRKGVKFHNDLGEFTARDVELAYQEVIRPGAQSGAANELRSTVERLEIVNDHEIVFVARYANYGLLEGLGYGAAGMAIKSRADWDKRGGVSPALGEPPIAGTGPYQFKERTAGKNVVFTRVPYQHWRQQPDFGELELRYMAENSTRLAALLAGEIHVTSLPTDMTEEAVAGGMRALPSAIPGRRAGLNFLGAYLAQESLEDGVRSTRPKYPDSPMNDVRVRRAVNKAIDRDALNRAFYGGKGERMYMWYWQPELRGWNEEWKTRWDEMYGFDAEAAKRLLAEAGYGAGGRPIRIGVLATVDQAESADVMEAIAGMLTDVGITAEILSMDKAEHRAKREALEFDCHLEYDVTSSEVITGFRNQGAPTVGRGRAVEIPEILTAYREVETELDLDRQATRYRDLGNLVFEAFQHVPLLRTRTEFVGGPGVADYTFPGSGVSADVTHVEYIKSA